MRTRFYPDLLLIGGMTVGLVMAVLFTSSSMIRIPLGLPVLLLFPGYTLIAALFPRREGLNFMERAALSLGVSIAVTTLASLLLCYLPWGIRLYPLLIFLALIILVTLAIAWYRRGNLVEQAAVSFSLSPLYRRLARQRLPDNVLSLFVAGSVVLAASTFVFSLAASRVGESFTEFYILGPDRKAGGYPSEFVLEGDKVIAVTYRLGAGDMVQEAGWPWGRVIVGITNREHQDLSCLVSVFIDGEKSRIWINGAETDVIGPIFVARDGRWESEIGIAPRNPGNYQRVEFVLQKQGDDTFRKSLHLWINAKASETPSLAT